MNKFRTAVIIVIAIALIALIYLTAINLENGDIASTVPGNQSSSVPTETEEQFMPGVDKNQFDADDFTEPTTTGTTPSAGADDGKTDSDKPDKETTADPETDSDDPTGATATTNPNDPTSSTDPTDETVTGTTEPTDETVSGNTDPTEDTETTDPTEETDPTISTEDTEATDPTEDQEDAFVPSGSDADDYLAYLALSGEEQEAFINSFPAVKDFVEWYNRVKDAYDKLHPDIEIEDGNINLVG